MPKSTPAGLVIAGFAFLFGFAFIWHIWWLAVLGLLGIFTTVIVRASRNEHEFTIPAADVKRIEDARYRELEASGVFEHIKTITDFGDDRSHGMSGQPANAT